MFNKIVITILLFSVMNCQALYGDCDFADFPVSDAMTIGEVAPNLVWNGQRMSVRAFIADSEVNNIIEFYHRAWRDAYADSVSAPWQQVANLTEECMKLVQVAKTRDGSAVEGRLAIIFPPATVSTGDFGADVLKPLGSTVISDMLNRDGPKINRLAIITSSENVATTADFYRTELSRRGWHLDQQYDQHDNVVYMFRKQLDEANVLLMPAGDVAQVMLSITTVH